MDDQIPRPRGAPPGGWGRETYWDGDTGVWVYPQRGAASMGTSSAADKHVATSPVHSEKQRASTKKRPRGESKGDACWEGNTSEWRHPKQNAASMRASRAHSKHVATLPEHSDKKEASEKADSWSGQAVAVNASIDKERVLFIRKHCPGQSDLHLISVRCDQVSKLSSEWHAVPSDRVNDQARLQPRKPSRKAAPLLTLDRLMACFRRISACRSYKLVV